MVICAFLFGPVPVTARITLPQLISDGMVLQRDVPLKINGWASPGEKVTLTFKNKKYRATAGRDSTWLINLPAQTAGGPGK